MTRDVIKRIAQHNRGRQPDLFQRKCERMRQSPFLFFRGTCHLFYEDWPARGKLNHAPLGWICGDLHLENFGVYKGDNRQVYFDLNDFDEAALAPCTWELARFSTSVLLASTEAGLSAAASRKLVTAYLSAYQQALIAGKARWLERAVVQGAIKSLLDHATTRTHVELLDRRTTIKAGVRQIRIDAEHTLPLSTTERAEVRTATQQFGRNLGRPKFFKVLDVARRVAGVGSLGVDRYMVLVEGKGSPDQNHLIDLKLAIPSEVGRSLRKLQPRWHSEAHRVVELQRRAQAVSPAFLSAIEVGGKYFVLRELQPLEDRLDLDDLAKNGQLEETIETMGQLTAWSHLRSGGRQGSATADDWIEFATKDGWMRRVADYSRSYQQTVELNWKEFRTAPITIK